MNKDITFCLTLKCEHCGNPTVFFRDCNEVESQCASGSCGKISRLNESEKQLAYVTFLETCYLAAVRSAVDFQKRLHEKDQERHFVKTPSGGWRLVYNNPTSIQWAVAQIF